MSCRKCKNKEDYTCGKKHNAKCIDYEGELHENTEIEECEQTSIEDVIEDINTELDLLHSQTNLSTLGTCLDYEQTPETITIPQAIKKHEDILCELIAHTGYGDPEPCPDCNTPCDNTAGGCCNSLKHFAHYTGETFINAATLPDWGPAPVAGYQVLKYTTTQAGIYKITLDVGTIEEDPGGRAFIGISKNGAPPSISPFEQYDILPKYMSKTFHFILNTTSGVELKVVFKGNTQGVIVIDGIKMIVEKVG